MASTTSTRTALATFLKENPHIISYEPGSERYQNVRESYVINTVTPLAILRPQGPQDVASIVRFATSNNIPFTVRVGGHDLFGRCFFEGAITIDLRSLNAISIAKDTAVIDGGVLTGELSAALAERGLATSIGSISSVGYAGWAMYGGYSLAAAHYGLGVDQIVGAKLVNAKGEMVQANEDLLFAIRGGGGCVGIVVELTIKVYPLENVLAGGLLFESSDITATSTTFSEGYRHLVDSGLPAELGVQPAYMNLPGLGKTLFLVFLWTSDDIELGREWLNKIKALGTVIHDSVEQTTIPAWQTATSALLPKTVYGRDATLSLRKLTPEVCKVIAEHVARMPSDPATLLSLHELRGPSTAPRSDTVFAAREAHFVVELIACSTAPELQGQAWQWATKFREALLRAADPADVLEKTYISLTAPEHADMPTMFGEKNWARLVEVKGDVDGRDVFAHSYVRFGN